MLSLCIKVSYALIAVLIGVMCSFGKRFSTAGGQSPVTIKAGQIALTVMFSFSRSTGPTQRVRPKRACFAVQYCGLTVEELVERIC